MTTMTTININNISSCAIRSAMEAKGLTEVEYAGTGYTNPDDWCTRIDFYWLGAVLIGATNGEPIWDAEAEQVAHECGVEL